MTKPETEERVSKRILALFTEEDLPGVMEQIKTERGRRDLADDLLLDFWEEVCGGRCLGLGNRRCRFWYAAERSCENPSENRGLCLRRIDKYLKGTERSVKDEVR